MALTFNDYLRALKEPVITPCIKMEWLNPDGTVAYEITQDLYNTTGTLNINYQAGCRRTFNIQIHNADNRYDVVLNKIWFGQQIKLSLGIYINNEAYLLPQGIFYITNPTEIYNTSTRAIQLNCTDKWAYLDGSLFGNLDGIYQTPLNANIFTAIKDLLLTTKGNGYPIDPIPPLLNNYFLEKEVTLYNGDKVPIVNTPFTARIDRGQTYADVLLQFNTMLAGMMYYNEHGQLVVEPNDYDLLDRDKEVLWKFTPDNTEMLSKSTEFKFTEMYNDIITVGAVLNGNLATGRATNKNIRSDTCVQLIGAKTKVFEDTNYYADELAQSWAEFLLKQYTVVNKSINLTCSPLYHLDVNKIITITDPKKNYDEERFLINSLTIPLSYAGSMTINATSVNDLIYADSNDSGNETEKETGFILAERGKQNYSGYWMDEKTWDENKVWYD